MSTITTPHGYKLGKEDPVESPFAEFKTYFSEALPKPPKSAHWGGRVAIPWDMDGNGPDSEVTIAPAGWSGCGDCVEAGKAHFLKTANYDCAGHQITLPTPNDVVTEYCAYQGCSPDQLFTDPTQYDNGEAIATSLVHWCQEEEYGVLLPFTAPVNPRNKTDLKNAIWLGGGVDLGIQLRQNNETQFPRDWTWTPKSSILGGHDIWACGYTETNYIAIVTWGQLIHMTWEDLMNSIDEAHAVIAPQMVAAGKTPSGLLIANWESDLKNIS
jgi:hypothetical protein